MLRYESTTDLTMVLTGTSSVTARMKASISLLLLDTGLKNMSSQENGCNSPNDISVDLNVKCTSKKEQKMIVILVLGGMSH